MARQSIADRFWSNVDKGDGQGCWLWTGPATQQGYGNFTLVNHYTTGAHRVSYTFANGPIPPKMCVCHHCDNPRCVRPDHLFVGTHSDNVQDMLAKGRNTPRRRSSQTACRNGHEFTRETEYFTPHGKRRCRVCVAGYKGQTFDPERKSGRGRPRTYRAA